MTDITHLLPWLSLILGALAIFGFFEQRRSAAIKEGVQSQNIAQLRKDVDHAYDKIHALEGSNHETDICLADVQANIKNIFAALTRIENKLDGRVE